MTRPRNDNDRAGGAWNEVPGWPARGWTRPCPRRRDGTAVEGTFLGGNSRALRFLGEDASVRTIAITDQLIVSNVGVNVLWGLHVRSRSGKPLARLTNTPVVSSYVINNCRNK